MILSTYVKHYTFNLALKIKYCKEADSVLNFGFDNRSF